MLLHFPRAIVEQLLDHTEKATAHRRLYDLAETAKPGLWLVGDQGVYLMSNGNPGLTRANDANAQITADRRPIICFAHEINADTLSFEIWWAAKGDSFGSDDGVEFFAATDLRSALATYRPGKDLALSITPTTMAIVQYVVAAA
jgi:hypothetical protein